MATGFQILLPFEVVFQHEMSFIKFDCQSLKWPRFGTVADLDCYLHQSSCFGFKVEPRGFSSVTLSLVFLRVCLFHFGYQQEIRLSHSEKRL